MAPLDFCVRPANEPPPWPMPVLRLPCGRSAISLQLVLQTALFLSFFLVGFRLPAPYNFAAFLVYTVLIGNFVTVPLDGLTSNALGRNVSNLRRAGYDDGTILAFVNLNTWASQLIGFVVVNHACTDNEVFSLEYYERLATSQPEKFGAMMVRIFVNLAVTEAIFAASHSLLHANKLLSEFHVFHHCCTFSSWTTNVMFHPVDLAIEFTGPAMSLFALHFGVFRDQATFLVTYVTFQLWYAYDHDEHLNLYHADHHRTCDSLYAIYTKIRGDAKKNILRERMGKSVISPLEWPKRSDKKI